MSRSLKGNPRCPAGHRCDWCGGLASAKHRDATRVHSDDDIAQELHDIAYYDPEDIELAWWELEKDRRRLTVVTHERLRVSLSALAGVE